MFYKKKELLKLCLLLIAAGMLYSYNDNLKQKNNNISATVPASDKYYRYLDINFCGNLKYDTIKTKEGIFDPIDDSLGYYKSIDNFYEKDGIVFRKSLTYAPCNNNGNDLIRIEYFQNVSKWINLDSYKDIDGTFFSTNNQVYFWWVNSSGHLIIPVEKADPVSFNPFSKICGGSDKNGIYYGSPNYGVYKLDLPTYKEFKFYAKDDNYWNSPSHFIVLDELVYDIKFDYKLNYYLVRNDTILISHLAKPID